MELHQIRYFLATCETLNFTKAAEASNITQPALTKALKLLEDELGGPLFDRQARPMRLTELGVHLRGKFRKLNDISVEISAQAKLFTSLDAAVYTLGVINTMGEQRFLPLFEHLQRAAPGISLTLKMIPQADLISALREGSLELAIIADFTSKANDFQLSPLLEEDYVVALPPEHPLTSYDAIPLKSLHGVDYVRRAHCELNTHIDNLLDQRGITVNERMATDQDAIARQMIEAGLGISILPRSVSYSVSAIRPLKDYELQRSLNLCHLENRMLSPSATKVKEIILNWQKDFIDQPDKVQT